MSDRIDKFFEAYRALTPDERREVSEALSAAAVSSALKRAGPFLTFTSDASDPDPAKVGKFRRYFMEAETEDE